MLNLENRLVGGALRLAERCLPIPALAGLFLLLASAEVVAREVVGRHGDFPPPRAPGRLTGPPGPPRSPWRRLRMVWGGRVALGMNWFLHLWPDRLGQARWSARCHYHGIEHLEAALAGGRPIVLATLHFGSPMLLSDWLRARGLRFAFLTSRAIDEFTPFRKHLSSLANRANGLEGVRSVYPLDQLWDARDFLGAPGALLGIAVDTRSGKGDIRVSGPGYSIRMATGGLRLASMANAAVIPCLIRFPGGLRVVVEFGEPVPDELVARRACHPLACEHIIRQLGPWLERHPGQCSSALLEAIESATGRGLEVPTPA